MRNPYLDDWETNRQAEIKELTAKGVVPLVHELDRLHESGELTDEIEDAAALRLVMRPPGLYDCTVTSPLTCEQAHWHRCGIRE